MLRRGKDTPVSKAACKKASSDPALLATDLADYLVLKGVAFRNAHHIVGAVVGLAEKKKKPLNKLTLKELQSIDKAFKADVKMVFDLSSTIDQRKTVGGPAISEVRKQLKNWKKRLSEN